MQSRRSSRGSNDTGSALNNGRALGHVSIDFAAKLNRAYPEFKYESLGLNGLRHLISPYLTYSVLETSSLDTSAIQGVDTLTPITRPRPINVGRFSAIDELEDWSVIRSGLRQRFLTKRNGQSHEWLYLDTYMDFLPAETDTLNSFSNIYNELRWSPLPWLRLSLESQFPIRESANDFSEIYLSSSFLIGDSTEVSAGLQYLNNHPIVADITQLDYSLYHRFSDKWGASLHHSWRLDQDTLVMQRYALHQSYKSWILSLELYHRDYLIDEEWGVTLGLTLRDFPDISLPLSVQR